MQVVCRGRARRARRAHRRKVTHVARSAHVDTFTKENLPPRSQWPEFLFDLPELAYPSTVNCATELLDSHVEAGNGVTRCMVSDRESWAYHDRPTTSKQVAPASVAEIGLVAGSRVP